MVTVSSLMTRGFVSVEPDETLERANDLMKRGGFRHLPVLEGGRLVGILSDRDLALASRFRTKEEPFAREFTFVTRVREVMTPCPITLSPVDSIEEAIRLAVDRKISACPVTEAGKVLGIVTTTDLLLYCLESIERLDEVDEEETE